MLMAIEPEAVFPAALIVGGQQRPGGVLLEAKTSERHRRPLPTSEVGSASLGDGHLIGLDAEIEARLVSHLGPEAGVEDRSKCFDRL